MNDATHTELVLRKPSATIQLSNTLSLVERKLMNLLIWHAQRVQHTTSSQPTTIPITQVMQALGWHESKNVENLKEAVLKLVGLAMSWNEYRTDRTTSWHACSFLTEGMIDHSKLEYIVNPRIVEQIRRPTLFAKMQLLVQSQFRKRYSLVLYEFLLDHMCRSGANSIRLKGIRLPALMGLLGVDGKIYAAEDGFKHFSARVLKPSIKEINEHGDLDVSYTPVREARRVVELVFDAKRKDTVQLPLGFEDPLSSPTPDLVEQLVAQGVRERAAHTLCRRYDREHIEAQLAQLHAQLAAGKTIRQRGAWLKSAIESDFRPQPAPAEIDAQQKRDAKRKAAADAAAAAAAQEALQRAFEAHRTARVRAAFSAQAPDVQAARKQAFADAIEQGRDPILLDAWQRRGFDNPMVAAVFFEPLKRELLTAPQDCDIEAFRRWSAVEETAAA